MKRHCPISSTPRNSLTYSSVVLLLLAFCATGNRHASSYTSCNFFNSRCNYFQFTREIEESLNNQKGVLPTGEIPSQLPINSRGDFSPKRTPILIHVLLLFAPSLSPGEPTRWPADHPLCKVRDPFEDRLQFPHSDP